MAACTSRAAPLMSRFKSNCSVIELEPSVLDEVISFTPAMWPSWRSSGAATDDAMISGLAPGSDAPTLMVGKSTCGSGATGNCKYATAPASAIAIVSSAVPTGPADEWRGNVHAICSRNNCRFQPVASERENFAASRPNHK